MQRSESFSETIQDEEFGTIRKSNKVRPFCIDVTKIKVTHLDILLINQLNAQILVLK